MQRTHVFCFICRVILAILMITSIVHVPGAMETKPSSDCGVPLPKSCSCSPSDKGISFTCFEAHLTSVPKIDVGPKVIKTLNLGKNDLTTVNMGDFYGLKISRLLLANNTITNLPLLAFWGLEYHLETLDLSFNQLTTVPADALKLLRNLRSLSLTANRITVLRHYDFGYLRSLEVLTIDNNPVHSISPTAFVGTRLYLLTLDQISLQEGLNGLTTKSLAYLRGLSLARNEIRQIPKSCFLQLSTLQYLNLDTNQIDSLPNDTFTGVEESLRTLEINDNNLRHVPVTTLRRLAKLESLAMAHNKIRTIFARSFNNSIMLQRLDLRYNSIYTISAYAFHGLDNVQRIDLRHNQLITLDDRTFYWQQPAGKEVLLFDNPWLCNCLIKWIKKDFLKGAPRLKVIADVEELVCSRPRGLKDLHITSIKLSDFTCNHDYYDYFTYDDTKKNAQEEDFRLEVAVDNYPDIRHDDDDVIEMDDTDHRYGKGFEEFDQGSADLMSRDASGFYDDEDVGTEGSAYHTEDYSYSDEIQVSSFK